MSDWNQEPATCACCGVTSTEGSATLCWQCEDERIEGRYDGTCEVRARWDRRMVALDLQRRAAQVRRANGIPDAGR